MKKEFPTPREIQKSKYYWLVELMVYGGKAMGDAFRDVGKIMVKDRKRLKKQK